jgi:hypothetical protein
VSTIPITPGAGELIRTDLGTASGANMQVVKLAEGTVGSDNLLTATVASGLLVQVSGAVAALPVVNTVPGNMMVNASGATVPVANAAGGSLVVSAPIATPVSVRISNGAANVDTLPVSIAATVPVSGTVGISGTPAVAQSGTWNIGALATITNPVTVTGSVALTGTSAVSGTVTAAQGAPAAVGNAWPIEVTDGVNTATVGSVSGTKGLNVVPLVSPIGAALSQADKTAFTEGTTYLNVIGGVYNDAPAGNPAANQASIARITPLRGVHVNLRTQAGAELGNLATAGGCNPLQVQPAASANFWKAHVAYTASQTGQAIYTPPSGHTFYLEGYIVTPTAAGAVTVFDQTNASASTIYSGTPQTTGLVVTPSRPIPSSAVNNALEYTTGAGAAGDITAWGYWI